MNSKLPVGVIGLGRMGQIYARHLARTIPQAQLVHVSDVIADRAQSLAAELGVEAWSADYRELLADPRVKAVFVTSSTSTHRDVVIAAAQAGKAIFCEKPIALTLEDTDQMIEVLDRTGTCFQAGFMRRKTPSKPAMQSMSSDRVKNRSSVSSARGTRRRSSTLDWDISSPHSLSVRSRWRAGAIQVVADWREDCGSVTASALRGRG